MLTGAVLGTARGAGGEGARGADPVGSGPPPFLNRKRPATATAGKGSGGSGAPPPPPGPGGLCQPRPCVSRGRLPFLHAHSRFPVQPFNGSSVSGDCSVAPRGARLQGEAFAVQLGRLRGAGKGDWSFPSTAAWPHRGLSLCGGVVVWGTPGLASNQLMNSVGLRPEPDVSLDAPAQNRANVAILFLALAPNIGVSFLPLPPPLFILLGPSSVGPGGTVLTPQPSLCSLPSCSLAPRSSCPGGREAK